MLKTDSSKVNADPKKNNFFNATAYKLLKSKTESQQHLQKLIGNINLFLVHVVSYDDIKRQ